MNLFGSKKVTTAERDMSKHIGQTKRHMLELKQRFMDVINRVPFVESFTGSNVRYVSGLRLPKMTKSERRMANADRAFDKFQDKLRGMSA